MINSKKFAIWIAVCLLILCFFLFNWKDMFSLKTDDECLEGARLELLSQLRNEKNTKCFTFYKVIDLNKETRQYRWIKTWKNNSDTIAVVAIIGRGYWTERYSYVEGNQDIWYKLGLVDLRESKIDSTLLDERAVRVIEKYKNYKICEYGK
jgi:hypothetical protein